MNNTDNGSMEIRTEGECPPVYEAADVTRLPGHWGSGDKAYSDFSWKCGNPICGHKLNASVSDENGYEHFRACEKCLQQNRITI